MNHLEDPSKPFKCTFENCTWSFVCKYKLDRHLLVHSGDKSHSCSECGRSFARDYNLLAHQRIHQAAKTDNVECSIQSCKMAFKTRKELSVHVERMHTFPRKCPQKRCLELFNSEEELQEHLLNHSQLHACSFPGCDKRFSKPFLLKQHSYSHTNQYPHKCNYPDCNKSFGTQHKLKRHQLIHENKKNFKCPYKGCDKTFNLKDYLDSHKHTHEVYKAFRCPFENCEKHFRRAETLKVHLQKHSAIRPHKCTFTGCQKTYLTLSNLKAHQKLHNSSSMGTSAEEAMMVTSDLDCDLLVDGSILSSEILSREELVAASFGELACGQYMNETILLPSSHQPTESLAMQHKLDDSDDINVLNDLDKEKLKDLQEEFVRNIYASSVNIDHSFLPRTCKEIGSPVPTQTATSSNSITATTSPTTVGNCSSMSKSSNVNDTEVTLEPSMELSTGNIEIDGACFEAGSCMPDHVYSNRLYNSNSTVNV